MGMGDSHTFRYSHYLFLIQLVENENYYLHDTDMLLFISIQLVGVTRFNALHCIERTPAVQG
jgi:hypothetical protein